jgi:hypothetical protein
MTRNPNIRKYRRVDVLRNDYTVGTFEPLAQSEKLDKLDTRDVHKLAHEYGTYIRLSEAMPHNPEFTSAVNNWRDLLDSAGAFDERGQLWPEYADDYERGYAGRVAKTMTDKTDSVG